MTNMPTLTDFPARNYDKLRFGDTDKIGHVNNAVFSTMYETGRSMMLEDPQASLMQPNRYFVIAKITINYLAEMRWPGNIDIGTAVKTIGNSSVTCVQALFQNGKCVSTAESVLVQLDGTTRRPAPWDDATRAALNQLRLADGAG